jgi:hypothetical protein
MKRILVLLSVVAPMMVMLAMSVAPAFAEWQTEGPNEGCRTEAFRVDETTISRGPLIDGKRSDDGQICLDGSGPNLKLYDNKPIT